MSDKELIKAAMNAPCAHKGEKRTEFPTVDCDFDCGNCDWNPREHERRLTEGEFINGSLHFKRRFN